MLQAALSVKWKSQCRYLFPRDGQPLPCTNGADPNVHAVVDDIRSCLLGATTAEGFEGARTTDQARLRLSNVEIGPYLTALQVPMQRCSVLSGAATLHPEYVVPGVVIPASKMLLSSLVPWLALWFLVFSVL